MCMHVLSLCFHACALQLSFSQDAYTIRVAGEEYGALNGAAIQLRCAAHLSNTLLVRPS